MPSSFFLSSEEILSLPEKEKQAFFNAFFSKLESGELRSCYFDGTQWVYDAWIRTTILSYFKTHSSMSMEGYPHSFDKIPLQNTSSLVRRIPGSLVRRGAYIGQNSILMPSFVNIGAYIGEGTMLDTWSTVGSCAYIGKRCHLSGGVGIGGVLEPVTQQPVIIEDDCFIGGRCEIAEGVHIGYGSVLAAGVFLTQSTRIYNRQTGEISFGSIPPLSVVVPGSLALDDRCSIAAALIVKTRDQKTSHKTALNDVLRDFKIDSCI